MVFLLTAGACSSGSGDSTTPPARIAVRSLTVADVETLITQAVEQAERQGASIVVAVTNREAVPLGAFSMTGSSGDLDLALEKAITAAFLSSNQHGFTSLTGCFITRPHFPPGVSNTPAGPLFGVPFSSLRGGDILPRGTVFTGEPGVAIMPGGVPIFKRGMLVGGLGITGGSNAFNLDLCLGDSQDEQVAMAAISGFEVPDDLRGDKIFLDGILLRYANVDTPANPNFSLNFSDLTSRGTVSLPVQDSPGSVFPREGEVNLGPSNDFRIRAGTLLTQTEVETIIDQAVVQADKTRAAIRRPVGIPARTFISVVDVDGSVLGIWRTRDATLFSFDVSAQKARTALAFSDPGHALGTRIRAVLGLAAGSDLAVSTRAVGFLSQDFFPPGIDVETLGRPVTPGPLFEGPEFQFQRNLGALPFGNGITIFPGGLPLYKNGQLAGAIGISGDGVDQDDLIAFAGAVGFEPPETIQSDMFFFDDVRLPYVKFPRNPEID